MTLKVTEYPEECEKCSWTVPADLRDKDDAKVAVVHPAFDQGGMALFHFKGESPPEGYKVELTPLRESKEVKRKAADGTESEGEPSKKTKQAKQSQPSAGRALETGNFDDPNGI
jgi:hypothetical protein